MQVLPRAPGPAEIAGHSPRPQPGEGVGIVLVEIHRLPDHIQHITAGVICKGKSVAGVPPGLVRADGVLQSAGLPDDGHGAVPHGDHLTQAAGLALGGHQKQIRACIDGHGQLLVVVQAHGHAAGILLGRPLEELLVLPVPLAQDHHLQGQLHHVVEHLAHQIQALVGHQAADDAHDGNVGLLPQAHELLQLRLVRLLARHVRRAVIDGDVGIRGGVIPLHVDAVQHAGELVAAAAHDAVQPVGEVGHLQLVGVSRRDGVDGVGAQDGALQQVHVPVHQNGAVIRPAVVQAEQVPQGLAAVAALVLNIMNGEHGPDTPEPLLPHAVVLQIDGHQGGLPVVAVDDLRPEPQVGQHPHHGPGEKSEPLAVVHVAVQLRTPEILLVVQEVPGDAVPFHGEQPAVAVAPGQVHIVVAFKMQLVAEFLLHLLVQGQHHRHIRALGRQRRRQGARHIRKASGFAERNRLAGRI